MSYHEYFGHEQEIQICVIGHYQSEQFTSEIFRSIILSHFPDAKCCISEINTNPSSIYKIKIRFKDKIKKLWQRKILQI